MWSGADSGLATIIVPLNPQDGVLTVETCTLGFTCIMEPKAIVQDPAETNTHYLPRLKRATESSPKQPGAGLKITPSIGRLHEESRACILR